MNRRIAPALIVIAIAAVACGREQIDLAASLGDGGPADDGSVGSSDACSAPPSTCLSSGLACRTPSECCSNRCASGYCVQSGACAPPDTPCTTRGACCSGRCEPSGGGALKCLGYCRADGARCEKSTECCSFACNGGVCGGALCKSAGEQCSSERECCSHDCENSRCTVEASCRATTEACGDGGAVCCSGACNGQTGRCDLGPGACREPETPCNVDADCCRGKCVVNAQGTPACSAPCLADGAGCNTAGDCCSGTCGGSPSTCGGVKLGCGG